MRSSTPNLDGLFIQKREEHRLQMAHRLIQIRVAAVSMWFVYTLAFGVFGDHADFRAVVPFTAMYAAAAAVLYLASRRYPVVVRRSWLSLPFIDLPMIFIVQYRGTPLADTPVGSAAFSVGILAILIVAAQLSMRIRNVLVTAAVAVVLEIVLFMRADTTLYAWLAAVIVLGTIGGAAAAVVEEFESLLSDIVAERTRIAREVHDTLAQGLAGISLQLENVADTIEISPEAARYHLDRARDLAGRSLAEARQAIYRLRSDPSAALSLSLSAAVERLSPDTAAQIEVQVSGPPRRLAAEVEANLLSIAQEAMANAIKHADAQMIDVELRFETRRVVLYVRDDGRGFDLERSRTSHFGLAGMQERADQIGGSLAVRTMHGLGTEIEVAI
jgi:signal transduction histidine kinase